MQPQDFTKHPYNSALGKSEPEVVARNIMVILSKTGNTFRLLAWDEYKEHRLKDGNFSEIEKSYFERVAGFCTTEAAALSFCPTWSE